MSLLKKLKTKQKKKPVSNALKLVTFFQKLEEQGLIVFKNNAVYIYRVLLTLGEKPQLFEQNLYSYAVTTRRIVRGFPLKIIDIETDAVIK
ncbi:hypothetical protein AAW12_15945 [Sphingobacterium sp. Ag1]|uniref:hypothetical protein n=1 Tax=Sphingobacterium sp. Ag1 TaxID=1643451 RepID=UPI000627D270|nr:hypothetical protein [Sphingobacterium sp. Ag1]KKO90569.1 hypothetical protein AAW12_15945 [Sphingobacterium sp. Ag1]